MGISNGKPKNLYNCKRCGNTIITEDIAVGKIERQRISKVSIVIVEVELFLKLGEEGMKNGFFSVNTGGQKIGFQAE